MKQMRTPRLIAAGVSGLLGAAALVGATTGSANAASSKITSPDVVYGCKSIAGNFDLTTVYTFPSQLSNGAAQNPVTVKATMDPSAADQLKPFLPLPVDLLAFEPDLGTGKPSDQGSFKFGDTPVSAHWSWTQKDASPTTVTGTFGEIPSTVTGDVPVTAPDNLDFQVTLNGLGAMDIWCAVEGTAPTFGTATVGSAAEGAPVSGKATVKGNVITYKATASDGNGGTEAGTGTVKATGKVKVAKGKKTVAKAVKASAKLKNGTAKLKLKLPKGTKKGAYKFTVTWGTLKSTVTVKVK